MEKIDFTRVDEVQAKYHQQLVTKSGNASDLLIAFEVINLLETVPVTNPHSFDKQWGKVMEDAKDYIRQAHKQMLGFVPNDVLEYCRLLYKFRCLEIRSVSSHLYWGILDKIKSAVPKPEHMDETLMIEANEVVADIISTKRLSIMGFIGNENGQEFETLMNDLVDELDEELGKRMDNKTSTNVNKQFKYATSVFEFLVTMLGISNSFNFKAVNEEVVDIYLNACIDYCIVEETNRVVLLEACKELVEV